MILTLVLTPAVAQNAEDSRLAGRWRDADLQLVSEFTRVVEDGGLR